MKIWGLMLKGSRQKSNSQSSESLRHCSLPCRSHLGCRDILHVTGGHCLIEFIHWSKQNQTMKSTTNSHLLQNMVLGATYKYKEKKCL